MRRTLAERGNYMQSGTNLLPQKILVAVDGSENVLKAVRVAAQMAKNSKAELTILHIAAIPSTNYRGGIIPTMAKIVDKIREGCKARRGESRCRGSLLSRARRSQG